MENSDQINLTKEKETLFITLYAKALDNRSKHPILNDDRADELIKNINYDFTKFRGFGNDVIVVRARQFDEWTKEFLRENGNAVVVYLGCGLDTRVTRINPSSKVSWFDVDYPEVIKLRKNFYFNFPGYQMIESSVTSDDWLAQIPRDRPTLIIAEGLLEYLTVEEVKKLFNQLTGYFSSGEMIFDVMNSLAILSSKEKLKKTTGAVQKWAVDNITAVDKLDPKLKRVTVIPIFKSKYLENLPTALRLILKLVSILPGFKNMLRLMRYKF